MKTSIYIFILVCILSFVKVSAQPIVSYGFNSRIGTYEEIRGGTIVGADLFDAQLRDKAFDSSSTPISELKTTSGIPIGFNFTFNDQAMNKFVIGSHGCIVLGKDQVKIDPKRGAFLLSDEGEGKNNIIGVGYNADLFGTDSTEISYKTTGTTPGRILTVQFKNLVMETDFIGGFKDVDLQIRLYETSGKIEIQFNNWENNSGMTKAGRVGLKGNKGDIHLRINESDDWSNTILSITDRVLYWGGKNYPANGLTYTFNLPPTCEKPVAQPTNLTLVSSSIKIEGSFKEIPSADHYLVVMTEEAALSATPDDRIFYKTDDKIGNGTVIVYDSITRFETTTTLSGTKTYYFHVFAVNSLCSFGPVYNTTAPLTASIKTLPEMPNSITVKETSFESISLTASANLTNDQIIIAMTDVPEKDIRGNTGNGVFGTPKGELQVGDVIEGGGTIVYKGGSKDGIKIENLTDNTIYHLMAWSVDPQNNYSSTSLTSKGLTWGKVPYKANFENMALYDAPFGWDVTGDSFRLSGQTNECLGNESTQLNCNITNGNPTVGKLNAAATQWIQLGTTTNRVIFRYVITTWTRATGNQPYNDWNEKDSLEVQISNDGTNYETLYQINKENAQKMQSASDWVTMRIPFDQMAGEKIKVRFRWNTYAAGSIRMIAEDINVEEKPACDYPINVSVDESSIVGGTAQIKWTATADENAWDIRYRQTGTEAWSEPFEVRTNPYTFTDLPTNSSVEVQVRAKCSLTSASPWSKTLTFTTGYSVPFTETFDKTELPAGWSFENGLLDNPTEFCTGSIMSCRKNWSLRNNSLSISYSSNVKDWVLTPKIDLGDGSYHSKLEFDLKLSLLNSNPIDENAYFALVISKDGGASFRKENVIKEWKAADITVIGDSTHYSVDLSPYTGIVRFGFYAMSTTNIGAQLTLDNIAFIESCPAAVNAQASEVTSESATIIWEGNANEWLTFVRKAGETLKEYTKQPEAKLTLTGLTPQTNYEVGITKACAANDTARVVIVSFTTQSLAPCALPEEITATPSQKFVTISWNGEADRYNIRFRQAGSEEWINKTSQTNTLTVDGLETETEYEYMLQAVCSSADGDVSPWTEVARVTTLAVTCFPPTDIAIQTTHKSATVTWNGEADNYQLAYKTGENAWNMQKTENVRTFTIESLSATTNYTLRMRSICAAGDTSEWSATSDFRTQEIPVCSLPTNLKASGITDTAAKLEWEADESNLSWDVRYRPGSVTNWTTISNLEVKNYQVNDLIPNTAYIWTVKATCDEGRTSAWAGQKTFESKPSGIDHIGAGDLKVYVSNRIINIQNPSNARIDRIVLYGMNGQVIKEYAINSDENVMIPTDLATDQIILKVYGKDFSTSYNLIVR